MSTKPIEGMAGTARFYPFAYLRIAAHNALDAAQAIPDGSNYQRVSAVLFAAFAVEAHLNHVGKDRLPFWSIVKPKLSWRAKLDLLAQHLGSNPILAAAPTRPSRRHSVSGTGWCMGRPGLTRMSTTRLRAHGKRNRTAWTQNGYDRGGMMPTSGVRWKMPMP